MTQVNENKKDDPAGIIDIEEFAKAGRQPPKGHRYRFRVDRELFVTNQECLTGREILTIAGKMPPENWILSQRKHKAVVPVGLDEQVDLTEPGVERFMTLPKDQTEGDPRRDFELSADDAEGLTALGHFWETVREAKKLWLLIHNFGLPTGYTVSQVTAAIEIPGNYRTGALDMVYFHPDVIRADGKVIRQVESKLAIQGKQFQRWSRHYTAQNPWNPEQHSILTHLVLVRHWLEREFARAA